MWTDSHCHIDYEGVGAAAIDAARAAGVGRMITVGTDERASRAAIATASTHDGVWATVGLHPHEASAGVAPIEAILAGAVPDGARPEDGRRSVVAVGECGLDYFYDHSPREAQREAFAAQIRLAHRHDLALVVHTRDAWDDTFAVLASEGVPPRWVLHCFSGGPAEAERGLEMGAYLSFSGIVTFKKADDVRAAAAACPLDRLLVETDSPYLAPVPHRGKPNQPAFVPLVGAAVAAVRGLDPDEVATATSANAAAVFALPA